jgi:hypothetical protein
VQPESTPQQSGRYVGVGIYAPEKQWTKLVATSPAKDTPAARPIDDQVIIVVVDSKTGEVRSCGDMTRYCIGMNPWAKSLTPSQIPPLNLTEHVQPPKSEEAADSAPAKPRSSPKRATSHVRGAERRG